MLCSASSDPRDARELTPAGKRAGRAADGHRPFVSEITDEQIVSYFNEMAPLSKTAFWCTTRRASASPSPRRCWNGCRDPERGRIKQAISPYRHRSDCQRLRGRLRLFCASDLAFLGPMMAGFDGVSTTNSGALPELIVNTFRAVERGDAATARDLHQLWYAYRRWRATRSAAAGGKRRWRCAALTAAPYAHR